MSCISYCNTVFQRVDDLPSLVDATRNHAYITPDNKIYILNADGTGYMQMSTDGGGVTVGLSSKDGSITIVETKDSVTHTFDISVSEDIINRITALENKPDKDTIYDDSVLETKINDILDKMTTMGGKYTAGRGLELVGNEFRVVCQAQNLAVRYADDEQGTGFRETPIAPVDNNIFNSLKWIVEQSSDPNANGNKLNVATTNNSMTITGSAVAGNDFVYARVEAEPNTEFTVSFDYTSSKTWSQYVDYLYFVASTTRTWGSHLKDLPSIKLPRPNSLYNTPQRLSMDFTVGEQGYIYLYVNHTNSTNYEGVEQTFSNFTIQPKNQEAKVGNRAKYIGLASVCPDGTDPKQPSEYTWLSMYNETESKTLEELRKQIESNQLVVNQQISQALTEFGEKMVANQGKAFTAGAGITITDDGVISLVDPTDNDTTYTAGNGLVLTGTEFAVNTTTDLVVNNDKLGIKPTYVQDNFYVNGTTLVKEKADGTKVQLDFTDLISYIDRNDVDTFARTQYVSQDNIYYPASTQGSTHVFNLTSQPRTAKLVNSYLILTMPSFFGKGTKISNGATTQTTLTQNIPTSFHIPVFNDNSSGRYFCETIRIDVLDIELVLSGYLGVSTSELRLTDVKLCVVSGKAHNNVEYKYFNFINDLWTYTRTLNGFNYEFRFTHVTKIEFWGLNIVK